MPSAAPSARTRTPCSTGRTQDRTERHLRSRAPRRAPRAESCERDTPGPGSSRGAELLTPIRIELAQSPDALADGRMCHEQSGKAFLHERVDRVERLCRRAAAERYELRGLIEPNERVGHQVR